MLNYYFKDSIKSFLQKNTEEIVGSISISNQLVSTEAKNSFLEILLTSHNDKLILPIKSSKDDLAEAVNGVLRFFKDSEIINGEDYAKGSYSPTPTIIEAAVSLYNNHSVDAIT